MGADGHLEMNKLLESLQQLFRKNAEHWVERLHGCMVGAGKSRLVVFDRTPGKPWEDKVFQREEEEEMQDRSVTVWEM